MNYIVVDLEATCWNPKNGQTNEIIEIGAVCVNENGNRLGEFVEIIKPRLNPVLSDFCVELTTITQEMVDEGVRFDIGLTKFISWIESFNKPYLICSWGFYDKKQFESDCRLFDLPTSWLNNHISLKHQYAEIKSINQAVGMKKALQMECLVLDGTHHRGIDDARNIAKILVCHLGKWKTK